MKTIIFCSHGQAVSDFDIDDFVNNIFAKPSLDLDEEWRVSTILVLDEIRARIAEQKVSPKSVLLKVTDKDSVIHIVDVDKYGAAETHYSTEFVGSNIAVRILQGGIRQRRQERRSES